MGHNLSDSRFSSTDYSEEESKFRWCMSFGKAVSALQASETDTAQFFKSFYNDFTKEANFQFDYKEVTDNYELPSGFSLEVCDDSSELFKIMISPATSLPVGFHHGHQRP